MKSNLRHTIILLVGVFFLASSALFAKVITISSTEIAFYRLFFSTLILLPALLSNRKLRNEIKSMSRRQLLFSILLGFLLSSHYVLWFESLNYTSIASSTVIVTLQPLFAVVFLYVLYKEKIGWIGLFGIVLSVVGSMIIGFDDFQTNSTALYGDLLAFIAAGFITAYFFVGETIRKNLSIIPFSIVSYLSSCILLLIYGVMQGLSFHGYSNETWLLLVGMAIASTLLGQMVINWVLKYLRATTVSVAILTEVIWAILMSFVILGEVVTVRQSLGISIILAGLILYTYKDKVIITK